MPLVLYSKDAPKTLPYIIDDKDPWGILSDSPYQEPTYEMIPFTARLGSPDNHMGGVITKDNKIFMVPHGYDNNSTSNKAYLFDVDTKECERLIGTSDSYVYRWAGGVLLPDGNIVAAPYNAGYILKYDAITKMVSRSNVTQTTNSKQYYGAVLGLNNKVYLCPAAGTRLIEYDPVTDTKQEKISALITTGNDKWFGGVVHPNGNIYFTPKTATKILKYNPQTDTVSAITAQAGYSSAVVAPNGKIYFFKVTAGGIMELDPTTDTVRSLSVGSISAMSSAALAPNGKIYGIGSRVYEFDPVTLTGRYLFPLITSWYATGGMILHPNGKIYCLPHVASNFLVIDTHCISKNPNACKLPYFNKL